MGRGSRYVDSYIYEAYVSQAEEDAMRVIWAIARQNGGTLRVNAATIAGMPKHVVLRPEVCPETSDLIITAEPPKP